MRVYPGASAPLLLAAKHDPEIHGVDGLGGVEGLPRSDSPEVRELFATHPDGTRVRALEGMSATIRATWKGGAGPQVTVISTGPMTNIAHFVSVYADLLPAVEEFVFMGGGVGMGNRSAVAEFNILCDRELLPACPAPVFLTYRMCSTRGTDGPQRTGQNDDDADQRHAYRDCNQGHPQRAALSR